LNNIPISTLFNIFDEMNVAFVRLLFVKTYSTVLQDIPAAP